MATLRCVLPVPVPPTKTTFVRASMKPPWHSVLILSALTDEDGKSKPSRSFITGNLAIPSLYRMLRMCRSAFSARSSASRIFSGVEPVLRPCSSSSS
jgi:hypothetical protein